MCCYAISNAQERIVELSTNARVIQQNQDLNLGRTPNSSNQFWIYTPITALPFQDDFSRIKNTNYNRNDYPPSAKSDTLWYNYKINGQ
jgi:hypothetical protein